MAVNYDDKRFTAVESDKKEALTDLENTYGNMIDKSDSFYQQQINASKNYAETQKKNQQAQTDFTIEEINQQKAQAKQDYTKEQSGAYTDWQKQSNQYGANAEKMAASGMTNTGYSESSLVSMYNQYQTRVATAREAYTRAVQNYDNAITEARLQNNSALAEIAYKALQDQLELSLQGFQYKNNLIMEKAEKKLSIESEYYNRWKDVLSQINTENALAEQQRQFNEQMAEEKRQFNKQMSFQEAQFAWQKAQANKSSSSSISKGGSRSGKTSKGGSSKVSSKAKEKITNDIKNSSSKENTKGGPVIDMQSVLDLGYGPISAAKLDDLIRKGMVKEYTQNGKRKFVKVYTKGTAVASNKKNLLR